LYLVYVCASLALGWLLDERVFQLPLRHHHFILINLLLGIMLLLPSLPLFALLLQLLSDVAFFFTDLLLFLLAPFLQTGNLQKLFRLILLGLKGLAHAVGN